MKLDDRGLYSEAVVVVPYDPEHDNDVSEQLVFDPEEVIPCSDPQVMDVESGSSQRLAVFLEVWDRCSSRIKGIAQESHVNITENILQFIEAAYDSQELILPYTELPVAIVVGDTTSTTAVLDSITQSLYEPSRVEGDNAFEPPVVHLSPKDFASLPNAMRAFVTAFISRQPQPKKQAQTTTLASHDILTLCAWYDSLDEKMPADQKLVVILPTVEACDPPVLRDFFHICSLHIPHLPLVFLLGTATSGDILNTMLPLSCRKKLGIETFVLESGNKMFQNIMEGLFMDFEFDPGFFLSESSYRTIIESYTLQQQSLDSFSSTIELLLMSHAAQPLSLFFTEQPSSPAVLSKFLQASASPSSSATKTIKSILQTAVNDSTSSTTTPKSSSVAMHNHLMLAHKSFTEQSQRFRLALRMLNVLLIGIKNYEPGLRTDLTYLLGRALAPSPASTSSSLGFPPHEAEVTKTPRKRKREHEDEDMIPNVEERSVGYAIFEGEVRRLVERVRQFHLPQLQATMALLDEFILSLPPNTGGFVSQQFRAELDAFRQHLQELKESVPSGRASPTKMTRSGILGGGMMMRREEVSEVSIQIASWLRQYFEQDLVPLVDVPLREIWTVEARSNPQELLNPPSRQTVLHTLHTPALLFPTKESPPASQSRLPRSPRKAKRDKGNGKAVDEPFSTLPDTTVLLRRYLDSGRMINAYDWFESFMVAMRGEPREKVDQMDVDGEDEDENRRNEDEGWRREMQARFLASYHEMDWMGLVRSTGRKKDSVMRTVYDVPPKDGGAM